VIGPCRIGFGDVQLRHHDWLISGVMLNERHPNPSSETMAFKVLPITATENRRSSRFGVAGEIPCGVLATWGPRLFPSGQIRRDSELNVSARADDQVALGRASS
jgi:hypothetical protein